jgi:hypothetical protein
MQDAVMMTISYAGKELVQKGLENGKVQTRIANVKVFLQVLI